MPLDASDPAAMMGGGAPPGGDSPQGAGFMAAPGAGMPPMAPGSPQATMMLGQLAAKMLQKQQGTKYAQGLLKHLSTILSKQIGAMMFDNPQAKSDVMDAIKKLENASIKLGQTGPSTSPQLTTSLADLVQAGSGAVGR